jgi:lambda family phage minor tail protein L
MLGFSAFSELPFGGLPSSPGMSVRQPRAVAAEVQRLSTDALVHLYTLDATGIGIDLVLRWTPSVIDGSTVPRALSFDGIQYTPYPIEAEGFEWRGKGPAPRPRVRVSNIGNVAGSLIVGYDDLVGAKVTRLRTFARFLDGFPNADPTSFIEPDVWFIERKVTHNPVQIEWELSSILDQQGRRLPGRQCMREVCTRAYRVWNPATLAFDYTGVTCPYVGTSYWTEDGVPTDAPNDRCGQRLTDCKLRGDVSGWTSLPTWAFPGLARVR